MLSRSANILERLEKKAGPATIKLIEQILESVGCLTPIEKLLLYLKLPTHSYTSSKSSSCELDTSTSNSSSASKWMKTHLRVNTGTSLSKQKLYSEYMSFCKDYDLSCATVVEFGQSLRTLFPNVRIRRLGKRGSPKCFYTGISFLTDRITPSCIPDITASGVAPSFSAAENTPAEDSDEELETRGGGHSRTVTASALAIIVEWAEKLLETSFVDVFQLAHHLVDKNYVNVLSSDAIIVSLSSTSTSAPMDVELKQPADSLATRTASDEPSHADDATQRRLATKDTLLKVLQKRSDLKHQRMRMEQGRVKVSHKDAACQVSISATCSENATVAPTHLSTVAMAAATYHCRPTSAVAGTHKSSPAVAVAATYNSRPTTAVSSSAVRKPVICRCPPQISGPKFILPKLSSAATGVFQQPTGTVEVSTNIPASGNVTSVIPVKSHSIILVPVSASNTSERRYAPGPAQVSSAGPHLSGPVSDQAPSSNRREELQSLSVHHLSDPKEVSDSSSAPHFFVPTSTVLFSSTASSVRCADLRAAQYNIHPMTIQNTGQPITADKSILPSMTLKHSCATSIFETIQNAKRTECLHVENRKEVFEKDDEKVREKLPCFKRSRFPSSQIPLSSLSTIYVQLETIPSSDFNDSNSAGFTTSSNCSGQTLSVTSQLINKTSLVVPSSANDKEFIVTSVAPSFESSKLEQGPASEITFCVKESQCFAVPRNTKTVIQNVTSNTVNTKQAENGNTYKVLNESVCFAGNSSKTDSRATTANIYKNSSFVKILSKADLQTFAEAEMISSPCSSVSNQRTETALGLFKTKTCKKRTSSKSVYSLLREQRNVVDIAGSNLYKDNRPVSELLKESRLFQKQKKESEGEACPQKMESESKVPLAMWLPDDSVTAGKKGISMSTECDTFQFDGSMNDSASLMTLAGVCSDAKHNDPDISSNLQQARGQPYQTNQNNSFIGGHKFLTNQCKSFIGNPQSLTSHVKAFIESQQSLSNQNKPLAEGQQSLNNQDNSLTGCQQYLTNQIKFQSSNYQASDLQSDIYPVTVCNNPSNQHIYAISKNCNQSKAMSLSSKRTIVPIVKNDVQPIMCNNRTLNSNSSSDMTLTTTSKKIHPLLLGTSYSSASTLTSTSSTVSSQICMVPVTSDILKSSGGSLIQLLATTVQNTIESHKPILCLSFKSFDGDCKGKIIQNQFNSGIKRKFDDLVEVGHSSFNPDIKVLKLADKFGTGTVRDNSSIKSRTHRILDPGLTGSHFIPDKRITSGDDAITSASKQVSRFNNEYTLQQLLKTDSDSPVFRKQLQQQIKLQQELLRHEQQQLLNSVVQRTCPTRSETTHLSNESSNYLVSHPSTASVFTFDGGDTSLYGKDSAARSLVVNEPSTPKTPVTPFSANLLSSAISDDNAGSHKFIPVCIHGTPLNADETVKPTATTARKLLPVLFSTQNVVKTDVGISTTGSSTMGKFAPSLKSCFSRLSFRKNLFGHDSLHVGKPRNSLLIAALKKDNSVNQRTAHVHTKHVDPSLTSTSQLSSAVGGLNQRNHELVPASCIRLPTKRVHCGAQFVGCRERGDDTFGGRDGGQSGRQRHHSAQDTSQMYYTTAELKNLLKLLQASDTRTQCVPPSTPTKSTQPSTSTQSNPPSILPQSVPPPECETYCSSPSSPELEVINSVTNRTYLNKEEEEEGMQRSVSAPSFDWTTSLLSLMDTEDLMSEVLIPRIDNTHTVYCPPMNVTGGDSREMLTPPSATITAAPISPPFVVLPRATDDGGGVQYLLNERKTVDNTICENIIDDLLSSMSDSN